MKNYISILMIALLVLSCSKNDDTNDVIPDAEHKIVGKWQNIAFMDDVAPLEWEQVENGEIVEFYATGEIGPLSDPNECTSLTYQVNETDGQDDEINYYCDDVLTKTLIFEINAMDELIIKYALEHRKFTRVTSEN